MPSHGHPNVILHVRRSVSAPGALVLFFVANAISNDHPIACTITLDAVEFEAIFFDHPRAILV